MPKNWKDWFIVITLGFIAIAALQNAYDIAFKDPFPELTAGTEKIRQSQEKLDEAFKEIKKYEQEKSAIGTPTIGIESKIIGKWLLLGDPSGVSSTTEYFKDGTYFEQFQNATDTRTESGNYKLVGGNKLKMAWEICDPTCSQHEIVVEVNFPDNNTMNVDYGEGADVLAYQRISP